MGRSGATGGHGLAQVEVEGHAGLHLAQGGIMGTHAFSQGSGTAHVLQVVHQALEGVQFLAHGLHLVPDFGLGRLHLAQQGIVFLHALLKIHAFVGSVAAALTHASAQHGGGADQATQRKKTFAVHRVLVSRFKVFHRRACDRRKYRSGPPAQAGKQR